MKIEKKYKDYKPGRKWFKTIVVKIVFFVFGKALKAVSQYDEDAKKEIELLPEGLTVIFEVVPFGPYMSCKIENGRIKYLGLKKVDEDNAFVFKHIEPIFKMLTGQIGLPQVYTENSLTTRGDLAASMIFYRVSNIVQFYLWPKFIAKIVLKKVPDMTIKKFFTRLLIYIRIII